MIEPVTGDQLAEAAALAVPAGYLAAQILTGKWNGRRGRNLGWALFGVPILTVGIVSHSWVVIGGGIVAFASPYLVERPFDSAWPPRR